MSTEINAEETFGSNLAVNIDGLSIYYGNNPALLDISIKFRDKDFVGIIGPNGGGKTTLLKAILGLVPVSSGKISVYGKRPGSTGRLIGYVPQISALDREFPATVHDVVLTGRLAPGLTLFHRYGREDGEKADELINKLGIYKVRNRRINELSGGEFQKMLIARALAVSPRLLLLDEPTASVDAGSRNDIYDFLDQLNQNMTIVLVTHDTMAISSHIKSLACLNRQLVYHGDPELNESVVTRLYGCPIDLIAHGVPHRVLKEHEGGK